MRRFVVAVLAFAALAVVDQAGALTSPPTVRARAFLVVDASTGDVLSSRNADRRLPIASITKLMTAVVTLERAKPSDVVAAPPSVSSVGESTILLKPGERLRVRDLLKAALVQSANDAAWSLAAHVGHGSVRRFVRLMNAKAEALGLRHTHFVRPDGLDVRGHYSSASDVLELARVAMRRPLIRRIVRLRNARIAGGRRLSTWNDLLRTFPGVVGVKTGHTDRALWNEVALVHRHGVALYGVILGSPTRARRNRDLARLLTWGLAQYGRIKLLAARRVYATADLPYSDERLALVADRGAGGVVRLDHPLVEKIVSQAVVGLPVQRGSRLGEIRIYDGTRLLVQRPLVAAAAIERPGVGGRIGWYAGRALDEAGDMLAGVAGLFG
jgi:serine-type D-Ala-D-Ala carboxypeptidase (penicillin-binding protein 5/6)